MVEFIKNFFGACINFIFGLISGHFDRRKEFTKKIIEKKFETYSELYSFLPTEIEHMPKDFMFNSMLVYGPADITLTVLEQQSDFLKSEIEKKSESKRSISNMDYNRLTRDYNNTLFEIEHMKKYIAEYEKNMSQLTKFENSPRLYNKFKTYSSIQVWNCYIQFVVVYRNSYNTSLGKSEIGKELINSLLNEIFIAIRKDLGVTP